jgi:hypothetical protein
MALDPRLFLGIGGPVPQQQMLPPGFHASPMPNAPPMGGQQGGGQMGIPGMGGMGGLMGMFGPNPSTSGAEMGAKENDGLGAAVSGIAGIQPNAAGGFTPPIMPTDIGSGGGGGFMSWLSKLRGGLF